MIREHLFHKRAPADPMFRWRGGEISRLEGLSDGVFAVTITLLVVSLQVPNTFYELWTTVRDLPAFLASFAMLMMAWRYHYVFFRRYGLEDFATSLLNGAFLFLLLFYAYPLKFLTTFLWRMVLGESVRPMFAIPEGVVWTHGEMFQRAGMMYFYSVGVVGLFGVLALMNLRAYALRGDLELDELELFLTRNSILSHLITVGVAVLSMLMLYVTSNPGLSGITYFLMAPAQTLSGVLGARRAERIRERLVE